MNTTLILVGVVCIIAAVVGGGLTALGIQLPAIESVRRQIVLGIIGLILVAVGTNLEGGSTEPRSEADRPVDEVDPANGGVDDTSSTVTSTQDPNQQGKASSQPNENTSSNPSEPERDPLASRTAAIESVVNELNEATPFYATAQNQFAKGTLAYNHFIISGRDVLVASTFTYDQGDGTGWPPPSPPTKAVTGYFCKLNASTAKLLKDGVRFVVTTNIIRGTNTSSSTYSIDCTAADP